MTLGIFYGQFPVNNIYSKVARGALKNRDLVTHNMHLVTFDPDNTFQRRTLASKIRKGHFKTGCCLKAKVSFI